MGTEAPSDPMGHSEFDGVVSVMLRRNRVLFCGLLLTVQSRERLLATPHSFNWLKALLAEIGDPNDGDIDSYA